MSSLPDSGLAGTHPKGPALLASPGELLGVGEGALSPQQNKLARGLAVQAALAAGTPALRRGGRGGVGRQHPGLQSLAQDRCHSRVTDELN